MPFKAEYGVETTTSYFEDSILSMRLELNEEETK